MYHIGTEHHPVDTPNGSPRKLFLFIPALLVHTIIAAVIIPVMCGFLLYSTVPLPGFVLRVPWVKPIVYYALSVLAGIGLSRVLDPMLFNTSRFVPILPAIYFLARAFAIQRRATDDLLSRLGAPTESLWLTAFLALNPFLCSVGYAVGGWIAASTTPEELEEIGSKMAFSEKVDSAWAKIVKLWRAGRTIDYPTEETERKSGPEE